MAWLARQFLRVLANVVVRARQPVIIGVTGSVGKTSARSAVAGTLRALLPHAYIREPVKNYNNEYGLPATIIGVPTPGRRVAAWTKLPLQAFAACLRPMYPDVLVLEYGIDHPGDMDWLLRIARPQIAVFTSLPAIPVHLEFFSSRDLLVAEKRKLVEGLTSEGVAVLNGDESEVRNFAVAAGARRVLRYGLHRGNDVRASSIHLVFAPGERDTPLVTGTSFTLHVGSKTAAVTLPGMVGRGAVFAALAAAACATQWGKPLADIASALGNLRPQPGRLRVLRGRDQVTILDDTYNASPAAMSLETLMTIPDRRHFAVLGGMAELGEAETSAHGKLAREVVERAPDGVWFVGERTKDLPTRVGNILSRWFPTSREAAVAAPSFILPGDVVLVKGSQVERMERVVAALLSEGARVRDLLVRQEPEWLVRE